MARAFILSHGERTPGSGDPFVPEGKSIAFYSEYDENTLREIGLAAVSAGDIEPAEVFAAGATLPNYQLTQFEDSAIAQHLAVESSATGGRLYFVGTDLATPTYLCTTPNACVATYPRHADGCGGALALIVEDEILSVSCRGVSGQRNPATKTMEGSTEFDQVNEGEAKRILAWAQTDPMAAMEYYQSLTDATRVMLDSSWNPLGTFAEKYFASGAASTPAAVLEARRYLEAYDEATFYDWSAQWDEKQREIILADAGLRAAYERGYAIRDPRGALLGDATTAVSSPTASLVAGLGAQAAALNHAVAGLTGSTADADAIAGIATAMATFMGDVSTVQNLAGQPGSEQLLQTTIGLYNAGADATTKVALHQENPDADSLAQLAASMDLVGQWAQSFSVSP